MIISVKYVEDIKISRRKMKEIRKYLEDNSIYYIENIEGFLFSPYLKTKVNENLEFCKNKINLPYVSYSDDVYKGYLISKKFLKETELVKKINSNYKKEFIL